MTQLGETQQGKCLGKLHAMRDVFTHQLLRGLDVAIQQQCGNGMVFAISGQDAFRAGEVETPHDTNVMIDVLQIVIQRAYRGLLPVI